MESAWFNIAQSGQAIFFGCGLVAYAYLTRLFDAHFARKKARDAKDDFMPELVNTLKSLVDRLEKHEHREEQIFGALLEALSKLQTPPTEVKRLLRTANEP